MQASHLRSPLRQEPLSLREIASDDMLVICKLKVWGSEK